MFSPEQIARIRTAQTQWNDQTLEPVLAKTPERQAEFITVSS